MRYLLVAILFCVSCSGNDIPRDGIWTSLQSYETGAETRAISRWIWPVRGEISSLYGLRRHPVRGIVRHHGGLDIAAPLSSPVFASADGQVTFAGGNGSYGLLVILRHEDGLFSYYGHLRTLLVDRGDWVEGGQIIALVGSSGLSTGPHLHFEVRREGSVIDPVSLINSK